MLGFLLEIKHITGYLNGLLQRHGFEISWNTGVEQSSSPEILLLQTGGNPGAEHLGEMAQMPTATSSYRGKE